MLRTFLVNFQTFGKLTVYCILYCVLVLYYIKLKTVGENNNLNFKVLCLTFANFSRLTAANLDPQHSHPQSSADENGHPTNCCQRVWVWEPEGILNY